MVGGIDPVFSQRWVLTQYHRSVVPLKIYPLHHGNRDTIHSRILVGEKLVIHQLANIHRYTENVFGICSFFAITVAFSPNFPCK